MCKYTCPTSIEEISTDNVYNSSGEQHCPPYKSMYTRRDKRNTTRLRIYTSYDHIHLSSAPTSHKYTIWHSYPTTPLLWLLRNPQRILCTVNKYTLNEMGRHN